MFLQSTRRSANRTAAKPARRRLSVEHLEARDVPSSVQGTVFEDLNGNASKDVGEPGLAGWTAFIDNDRNGINDSGVTSLPTAADGQYSIDTTDVEAFVGTTGNLSHFVALDLQTGTGGRWVNTTGTIGSAAPVATEPLAIRNFGVRFVTDAQAGLAPVEAEQLVNVATDGQQAIEGPSVSANAGGKYVVAWRTVVPGGNDILTARVFDADGTPRSGDVTIATPVSTAGTGISISYPPMVAMADNYGQFAVAWTALNPTNGAFNAYASTYSVDGVRLSGPTSVATSTSTIRNFVTGIATDQNGNFVVLFAKETQNHFGYWASGPISAQRFLANGVPVGNVISVATPKLYGGSKSVAMADNGNFVVVYADIVKNVSYIYAQRYTAIGQKSGSQITVASESVNPGGVRQSNVAMNGAGKFVVSWVSQFDGPNLVRVYNAAGTPAGPAVPIVRTGSSGEVGLAIDDGGNVTLTWTHQFGGGLAAREVMVQRLPGGVAPKAATLANATTQGAQATNASSGIAAAGTGNFIAAWQGNGPDDDAGIFAQQFAPVAPLSAAGGPVAGPAAPLTDARVRPVIDEAVRRWTQTGLTSAERDLLKKVTVRIADLDGTTLGLTTGSTITLDRNAAGFGWFVDPTPRSDGEFLRKGDQGEHGRMDLLTALVHELGHVLGRDHADGAMAELLAAGTRESIVPGVRVGPPVKAAPTARPAWFLASGRR